MKHFDGVEIKRPCGFCEQGNGGAAVVAAHQYLLDQTALAPGHERTKKALRVAAEAGKASRAAKA